MISTGGHIFHLKNIHVCNPWNLAVLKTLNTHGGINLALSFPHNIIFLEKRLC